MPATDKLPAADVLIARGTEPTLVNYTGLWRFQTPVRVERLAPCRKSCPLGSGVPLWLEKVKENDWAAAWAVMEQYNPFPALTGYACYGYCQEECNRAYYDENVEIKEMEKAVGLWKLKQGKGEQEKLKQGQKEEVKPEQGNLEEEILEQGIQEEEILEEGILEQGIQEEGILEQRILEQGSPCLPGIKPLASGEQKSVAILGSGPAGLSAAYYLNRLGVKVTVLEKLPVAGGLMATGIPPERLPRDILQQELALLQKNGITIRTGVRIGRDYTLDCLNHFFDAVLLAAGAQKRRFLGLPGETLAGVFDAIELLRKLYLEGVDHYGELNKRIIVFGGGNAALDAATAMLRRGADEVLVVYRRGQEELPAHPAEIEAAQEAGVCFLFQTRPLEIMGEGAVTGVRLIKTSPSRRGEAVTDIEGSAYTLSCSAVILATGSERGLQEITADHAPVQDTELLQILNIPTGSAGKKLWLVAGDGVTGPQNMALAIAGGRLAARYLVQHFYGKEMWQETFGLEDPSGKDAPAVAFEQLSPHYYPRQGKQSDPRDEAGRCFSCGLCNRCGVCWFFCPDLSVEKESGEFEFLLDYCKGCGICAAECPAGVLEMKELKRHENAVER